MLDVFIMCLLLFPGGKEYATGRRRSALIGGLALGVVASSHRQAHAILLSGWALLLAFQLGQFSLSGRHQLTDLENWIVPLLVLALACIGVWLGMSVRHDRRALR